MLAHPVILWFINTDLGAANGYGTKMSPRNHSVPLAESQHHVIDPTHSGRALDDGIENRLHVRRRAADDAEHLGRRRLMLQRFAQFCVALLDFLEQAHVLDRDHGLIGEGFEKCDLLFGEGPDSVRRIRSLRWVRLRAAREWQVRFEFPVAGQIGFREFSFEVAARS